MTREGLRTGETGAEEEHVGRRRLLLIDRLDCADHYLRLSDGRVVKVQDFVDVSDTGESQCGEHVNNAFNNLQAMYDEQDPEFDISKDDLTMMFDHYYESLVVRA